MPAAPRSRNSPIRSALLVMLLIGFTSVLVGGTAAVLNATTTHSGFIATPSLPGAGGTLTAVDSNGDVSLTWASTSFGNGNEYELYRSNNGISLAASGASCPANAAINDELSYTSGIAIGDATGAALTDSSTETMTSSSNGFLCYMLFSAFTSGTAPSAAVWLSHPIASPWNPISNAHLPLVVTSVVFTDNVTACTGGGTTCTLDTGDTIQLTYNQPTTHPAIGGPSSNVCVSHTTGVIKLDTSFGANTCGASGALGSVTPPGACTSPTCWTTASGSKDADYTATYTWNPAAGSGCPTTGTANNTVLCIKVTVSANTPLTFKDNTSAWVLTPSTAANVKSNDAVAGNQVSVCTTGTGCLPGTTTRP